MKWDIFLQKERQARRRESDEFDQIVKIIEKFAPREHRKNREMYYYHYRMMDLYAKPLLALLQTLSHKERLKTDRSQLARELFVLLKGFYDPKRKLSLSEALEDRNLIKKWSQLFLLFYGIQDMSTQLLDDLLKDT